MAFLIIKTLKALLPNSRLSYSKIFSTRTMTSESAHRVFQLKLDPLTGNSEWVIIEENETETDDEKESTLTNPHNGLLATTSYLDMLNDSPRNKAYREAIEKSITKPCHVLDIGAGTGLLSMMAARAMGCNDSASSADAQGKVTACESYLPMVKLMRKVMHMNRMTKNIHLINKRSDELQVGADIESHADFLVSEILDSELLGEGLIPTLQHAYDKLLVDNPLTVPYRATIFGQLVECKYLEKLHNLYNYEAEASDGIYLVPTGLERILSVQLKQHPMHCDALAKEIKPLSQPFRIFEFDFWRRPMSSGETALDIKAASDGEAHAVVSWWTLQLDYEGSIYYSTSPDWVPRQNELCARKWCDHWKQCVWFLPGRGLPLLEGEEVSFQGVHNETSISYQLRAYSSKSTEDQCGVLAGDFHITLSPERIATYGDCQWRSSMLKAVANALQKKLPSLCIIADDSIFLSIAVARLSKAPKILAFFPGLRDKGGQYLQAVSAANGFSMDRMEVVKKKTMCLTLHDTHQKEVDLLIAEPFYYGTEGMLPWQNLRFWKERTSLDSVLSKDALIVPCKGMLKVCAMSLPDLWNSRRALGKIEGFDHLIANGTLGACGDTAEGGPCLPFHIWQCGIVTRLSEILPIMEFDFSSKIDQTYGKAEVNFTVNGICHGFAMWIDWVMDAENSIIISTGPDQRYWKQGVKLLPKPILVGTPGSNTGSISSLVVETWFDPSTGELKIQHKSS